MASVLASALAIIAIFSTCINSQTLVPAIIIFGDSSVDIGNNDYLATVFRADYPPYGRDFKGKKATGRFSNGKLATDITAETLGFTSYPPAYLSPAASGQNLLIGANFASAGSGYDDKTAHLSNVLSLTQQVEFFKEYQEKLKKVAGSTNASAIISGALYIVAFGSSDLVQNYYINPLINKVITVDQYTSYLVSLFSQLIQTLYSLGARRIGVTSLPPIGCVPIARTIFGSHQPGCVTQFNTDAKNFNKKANTAAAQLLKQLSSLRLVIFDIYQPFFDLVNKPTDSGFFEAGRGCCGTGTIEVTSLLCNRHSIGTCANATAYVFWDSVHPTEGVYSVLADALILQGIGLIS